MLSKNNINKYFKSKEHKEVLLDFFGLYGSDIIRDSHIKINEKISQLGSDRIILGSDNIEKGIETMILVFYEYYEKKILNKNINVDKYQYNMNLFKDQYDSIKK